jgi:hypothetical protein
LSYLGWTCGFIQDVGVIVDKWKAAN